MDGFAVRSADVATASPERPVTLRVIGEVAAGHVPHGRRGGRHRGAHPDRRASCRRARTRSCRSRTPTRRPAWPTCRHRSPSASLDHAGRHIRRAGSDLHAGSVVLEAGATITPAAVAALAATGHASVLVHGRPRVAILATGDELVPPASRSVRPDPGQQRAGTRGPGARTRRRGRSARASRATTSTTSAHGCARAWSGRTWSSSAAACRSVPTTWSRGASRRSASCELWRVAVQPGKPLAFGRATAGRAHVSCSACRATRSAAS